MQRAALLEQKAGPLIQANSLQTQPGRAASIGENSVRHPCSNRPALSLFALAIAFSAWACMGAGSSGVVCVVENKTAELADVTVRIYDKEFAVSGLAPGGTFSFEFVPSADAHYEVEVAFDSGARYTQETGYVTSGVALRHRIEVGRETVELTATTN